MRMTERAAYLLTILGMLSYGVYKIDWFSGHYDNLNKELEVLAKICKKANIKIDVCNLDTGKCGE